MEYCESIYQTKRWLTREVMVGKVGVGGNNPVRIQSMTTSDTRDVAATVDQIIRLSDVGCEIARVTVQGKKEAEACEAIKNTLVRKGYDIPLVADIHFYPPAAMEVVEYVDKVRVNPGNYVDKRATFRVLEYDDATYAAELDKIEEKFAPLVLKSKALGKSMRIGTNHGSLSDRIMNRYGDTSQGMVESALEFARVARKHDYHDFMFSMKASNPQVMIQAYRLLVAAMRELGWNYPLHLGVTEAGEGEDGRVKSAMGIGALLLDGLGDTIRVSLTEDPWYEIDPCKRLVAFAAQHEGKGIARFEEKHRAIEAISRRPVEFSSKVPLHRDGTVMITASEPPHFAKREAVPDAVVMLNGDPRDQEWQALGDRGVGLIAPSSSAGATPLVSLKQADALRFHSSSSSVAILVEDESESQWERLVALEPGLILFKPKGSPVHEGRRFLDWVRERRIEAPVIFWLAYEGLEWEDLVIRFSAEAGALLCDGLGEGVCLEADFPESKRTQLAFQVLQGARMRAFKTEFISCPSCGRTLFNLQEVSARIRARTDHLPGVKIAIMGCIVNGPGEMADADFGYVGSRPGKVDLYVGRECVERYVDFEEADSRLIELIKSHGRWVEAQPEEVVVG